MAVNAQIVVPCIDSSRINQYFPCGPSFDPVCGCDANTYSNECEAYNQAGVNTINHSGVCLNDLFYYDFWPNPVKNRMQFNLLIAAGEDIDLTMQIIDVFGSRVYTKLINNLNSDIPYQESIELSGLDKGVYFLMLNAKGVYKVTKFVKI